MYIVFVTNILLNRVVTPFSFERQVSNVTKLLRFSYKIIHTPNGMAQMECVLK